MYWKLHCTPQDPAPDFTADGRFVLQRHIDTDGKHLDLRLEQGDSLTGWRIDATELDDEVWATEKPPHPVRWLHDDSGLQRVDAGVYAWQSFAADRRTLLLRGRDGDRVVQAVRETTLPPSAVRDITRALTKHGVNTASIAQLLHDGAHARERAIARLCGLGRELDGNAFNEPAWRKALAGLSLDEIHAQLRPYEARFDQKYPPQTTSQPEALPTEDNAPPNTQHAWQILNSG